MHTLICHVELYDSETNLQDRREYCLGFQTRNAFVLCKDEKT